MWYKTGTIALTSGSAVVTGTGTAFIANVSPGEALIAPNGAIIEVQSVNSDTQLTLATNYYGASASGQTYAIIPTQSYLRDLASQVATLINNYSTIYNTAGQGKFSAGTLAAPGISFQLDQDTGFYCSGANEITFVSNGAAVFKYSATNGVQFLTAAVDINNGTIDGTAIGNSVPATGAFSNLSGYHLEVGSNSYGAASLNANSPATANFRSNGHTQLAFGSEINSGAGHPVWLQAKHGSLDGVAYPMQLNPMGGKVKVGPDGLECGGNIAVGATPSAAWGNLSAIDIGNSGTIYTYGKGYATSNPLLNISNNTYTNSALAQVYKQTGAAASYQMYLNTHSWLSAASGSAGATAALTEVMKIDGAGRWSVGGNPNYACHMIGLYSGEATGTSQILEIYNKGIDDAALFMNASGAGNSNAAGCALRIGGASATGRSINAWGTINAQGADYAEYEKNNGETIAKGDIVGFKSDGTLTTKFKDAIRFAVKSTNPSLVGGDLYGGKDVVGARPVAPKKPEVEYKGAPYPGPKPAFVSKFEFPDICQQDSESAATFEVRKAFWEEAKSRAKAEYDTALATFATTLSSWQAAFDSWKVGQDSYEIQVSVAMSAYATELELYERNLQVFEEKLEASRKQVDRIAYCGKVPVNVLNALPGEYIVAAEGADGGIVGVRYGADIDFSQYAKAVGRVNRILEDGRCEIVVIPH